MFDKELIPVLKNRMRKGFTIGFSFMLHGLAILSLLVVPLMQAENANPELVITRVNIASLPPAPSIPPAGRGGKGKTRLGKKVTVKRPQTKEMPVFATPIEAPDSITMDDLFTISPQGSGTGVPGSPGPISADDSNDPSYLPDGDDAPKEPEPPIRISVTRAKLIRRVEPLYPPVALAARIQGAVLVEATTDIYGRVKEARIVTGHPLLNHAALFAVKQWEYSPYLVNAVPKPVRFTVTILFRIK